MVDFEELLTTSQVAEIIGLAGAESVVTLISRKKIKAYKFGRQWLILLSEAERYRDERPGKGGRPKKKKKRTNEAAAPTTTDTPEK